MNFQNTVDISIIIPVYNTEKYLKKCLESVRRQTFQNWEAICINDGSTDGSLNILKETAQKDKRFIIKEQSNQGVSAARNTGLALTGGKYVMFLDSDDFIHPQCMETAYNLMIKTKADICDFKLQKVTEKQNIAYQLLPACKKTKLIEFPLQKIIKGTEDASLLSFSKKLYKAELAKKIKFRPIPVGEDILYSFELMDYVKICVKIPDVLLYYVQRNSSVSHEDDKIKRYKQKMLMSEHLIVIIKNLCQKYSQTAFEEELLRYLSRYLFKVYIRKVCKLRLPDFRQRLNENMKLLNSLAKERLFNHKFLNFRFKLMFWLLQHKYYKPVLLLT